jgi:hypothetical protein
MKIKKLIFLIVTYGIFYIFLETSLRAFRLDLYRAGCLDVVPWSLAGWTSLWMLVIGGLSGLFIGVINEIQWVKKNLPMICQTLISAVGITVIELIAGIFFNILLGMNLWDYSDMKFNIMGQINLMHCLIWFILSPFWFWLDDHVRYHIYKEQEPDKLVTFYTKLLTGK